MPLSKVVVIALSLSGIVALGGYAWFAQRGLPLPWMSASAPTASTLARPAMPIAVETVEVRAVSMAEEATAIGNLRSNESVVLRPEISGRLRAISFTEGQPVSRGDVLFELGDAVERAELRHALANLELAESNFRRSTDLFERNFVSQSAREEASSRLAVARAATELARARLERMRIVAPFSGVIGIRNVSVGEYVKDGDPLVNLEDVSVLKVDFRLPEVFLQRIRPGQALEVVSDTLPGERFPATVAAIDPQLDVQGRAVLLRAELRNHDGRLHPGMFARVTLMLAERQSVLVVPEQAVVPAPGEMNHVYRVVDGKALRVNVKTGARRDAQVEIVEGLQAGDVIVTAGQLKLRDGVAVRLVATDSSDELDGSAEGVAPSNAVANAR